MPEKGVPLSEDTKNKISKANKKAWSEKPEGRKISELHKERLRKAAKKRWAREREIRAKVEAKVEKKVKAKIEKKTVAPIKASPEPVSLEPVKNVGGRPKKQIIDYIDIDSLQTQFQTAEELRGYILYKTNNGRDIVDQLIRDYKSPKTSKTVRMATAKMLIEMITPKPNQSFELGMSSPDGQFIFRWQNEVLKESSNG